MIENALIEEGGLGRKFNPVDKLKVNTTDSKDSLWVPEESHKTGVLHAYENGIYLAENDGYESYHQVLVRVENNISNSEEPETWDEVDPTDEADMWDEKTLEDYLEDPEAFDDLFNDEDEWDDEGEETDEEKGLKFDEEKEDKLENNKLTGKDLNVDPTGNNDYEVGTDENGNLTEEMVPAAIHIVVPPRKRKYLEGETLDFSGIHVYLMDGNNHRYTDRQYPTGEIPFNELSFDPLTAEGSEEMIHNVSSAGYLMTLRTTGLTKRDYAKKYDGDAYLVLVQERGGANNQLFYTPVLAGLNETAVHMQYREYYSSGVSEWYDWGYSSRNQGYYFTHCAGQMGDLVESSIPCFGTFESTTEAENAIIEAIGSGEFGGSKVTVSWTRSDGEILKDTYEIKIVSEEEPVPEPEPDPWGGYADVSWGGHHYNLNRRIVPEVHYANGYLWQEGISYEYNVEQAASMGWLILIR